MKRIGTLLVALLMMFGLALPMSSANAIGRTRSVTVITDAMPTRISLHYRGLPRSTTKRVYCVGVTTGGGKMRTVTLRSRGRVVMRTRVAANRSIQCLNNQFLTGPVVRVRVTEDIIGPWNLVGHKTIRLR